MAVQVSTMGEVIVRVPSGTSDHQVQKLLDEKADWIARHQTKMRQRQSDVLKAGRGEEVLFGKKFEVRMGLGKTPQLASGVLTYPSGWTDSKKRKFRRQLLSRFCEREIENGRQDLLRLRPELKECPSGAFRLLEMKRRWGSCGRDGGLIFNARLVEASPEAIRFVIRHELAHWLHFNHSKAFRALEEEMVGGRERLKAAQAALNRCSMG